MGIIVVNSSKENSCKPLSFSGLDYFLRFDNSAMENLYALLVFSPLLISLFWALTTAVSIASNRALFKLPLLLFLADASFALFASASVYFLDYAMFLRIYVPAVFSTLALFPLFHLYISCLTSEQPLKVSVWLKHLFLPGIHAVVALFFHYVLLEPGERSEWAIYLLTKSGTGEGLIGHTAMLDTYFRKYFLFTAILYFWLTDRKIRQHRKALENYFSNTENADVRWFSIYRIAFLFTLLSAFLYFTLSRSFATSNPQLTEASHLLLAIFFWIIGYYGQSQANIYPVLHATDKQNEKPESGVSQNLEALGVKLKEIMESRELFTRRDLTLPGLARVLGTNRTYLSRLFNERMQMSFNHYINQMRIEYYIKHATKSDPDNHSDLWLVCGFNSSSSFYRWFQLLKGMSPAAYLKETGKSIGESESQVTGNKNPLQ